MSKVTELVAKWDKEADAYGLLETKAAKRSCARELEQALTAEQAQPASCTCVTLEGKGICNGCAQMLRQQLERVRNINAEILGQPEQAQPERSMVGDSGDAEIFRLACKLVDTATGDRKFIWLPVLSQLCEAVRKQDSDEGRPVAAVQPEQARPGGQALESEHGGGALRLDYREWAIKALYVPGFDHHWIPEHYEASLTHTAEVMREVVEAALAAQPKGAQTTISVGLNNPPTCPIHSETMVLSFYDRPGSPPGNGWVCKSCVAVRAKGPDAESAIRRETGKVRP